MCAAELRRRAGVYPPVRTSCFTSADGSLMMIMCADLKAAPVAHSCTGILVSLIGRPLGYEANGHRLHTSHRVLRRPA
jgi:hypothetical protein